MHSIKCKIDIFENNFFSSLYENLFSLFLYYSLFKINLRILTEFRIYALWELCYKTVKKATTTEFVIILKLILHEI